MGITPNRPSQPDHLQGLGLEDRQRNVWVSWREPAVQQSPASAEPQHSSGPSQGQHPPSALEQGLTAPPGGSCRHPARCRLKRNKRLSFLKRNLKGFPSCSVVKNLPANAGGSGSTPGLGGSPGEGNDNAFQYSCLENPKDREAWWATIHGFAKSRTQLGTHEGKQG